MTSDLNIPDTNAGIILSIVLTALVIVSRSPNLMKLLDGCAKRIMCIPTLIRIIHLKQRQNVTIVQEIDKQDNAAVIKKLDLPDEMINGIYDNLPSELAKGLRKLAPGKNGTIDADVVVTWVQAINIVIENQNEKLKPLEMKKP